MIQVGRLAALCASLVMLGLSPEPGHGAARKTPELTLTYDVSVYGLRAMRWQVTLARGSDDYATQFQAHASGLPSLVSDLTIHARAGGRQSDGRIRPRSYTSRYLDGDGARSVLIAYGANGPIMTEAQPPAQEDDRDAVPKEALAGALDPLAGSYALLREVAETGSCQGEAAIFDGRRLFQLSLRPARVADTGDAAATKTMHCHASLDKVAGFKPRERRDNRFPDELLIELARVGPDGDLLPVRITAEHHAGPVSITLVDARVDADTATVPRADMLAWRSSGSSDDRHRSPAGVGPHRSGG